MDPFIGQIMLVAFNWAPQGWALCAGQTLSIAQNSALFALIGTTYGGDGVTTFALPDLRGRAAIGQGNGPGLSPVVIGEVAGSENVTLTANQMPMHAHAVSGAVSGLNASVAIPATSAAATVSTPSNTTVLATVTEGEGGVVHAYAPAATDTTLLPFNAPVTGNLSTITAPAGGSQPLPVRNPYLGLNYIIALEGIFPSRP